MSKIEFSTYYPSAVELDEEEEAMITAMFAANLGGLAQSGGSLMTWHGGALGHDHIEKLRQHIAPHMSGAGFMDFLKSSAVKGTMKDSLKGGLSGGIAAFQGTQGSFKDKLLGALKGVAAGAAGGVMGNAGSLLQAGIGSSTTAQKVLSALA